MLIEFEADVNAASKVRIFFISGEYDLVPFSSTANIIIAFQHCFVIGPYNL